MPLLGLVLGRSLASALGHAAHWIAAALLIGVGIAVASGILKLAALASPHG
jgi:putative Mn2+ efflux pump MntP